MRRYMLGIAFAITSFMPAFGLADDQQIADFVKSRLQAHQQQGKLRGFNVDMTVEQGVVWFKGHVSNAEQESLILQTAQQAGHLGVVKVVDDIEVMGRQSAVATAPVMRDQSPLQPASFQQPIAPMQAGGQRGPGVPAQPANFGRPQELPMESSAPVSGGLPMEYSGQAQGGMPMAFAETAMRAPMMDANCPPGGGGGQMPMGYGGGQMGMESPNLPGYAWPGYAAHPNYGQVAYPKQYSPSAWPYIGPFYPYPQVPLGWRKVSLQWDDGWWFLDFHDKCGSGR